MKRLLVIFCFVAAAFGVARAHGDDDAFYGVFYRSLDPYGEWILVEGGLYAWRPMGVHEGWRPYTVGRWMWTSYGWYWVSAEPWGWSTYHYGRWFLDPFHGWVWLPGREWAPAWVEWREGDGVIGWAPLPPYAVFNISIGISFSTHWVTPHSWWTFVDCRHMGAPSIHRYVYRPRYNDRYVGRTRAAGSVRYHDGAIRSVGPDRETVERRGRIRLPEADVVQGREKGERIIGNDRGRRVEVYKPDLRERGREELIRPGRVREGRLRLETDAVAPAQRGDGDRRSGRDPAVRERGRDSRDDDRSSGRQPAEVRVRRPEERREAPDLRRDAQRERAPRREAAPRERMDRNRTEPSRPHDGRTGSISRPGGREENRPGRSGRDEEGRGRGRPRGG